MREERAHERLEPPELPHEPHRAVDGADLVRDALPLGRVDVGVAELDVRPQERVRDRVRHVCDGVAHFLQFLFEFLSRERTGGR